MTTQSTTVILNAPTTALGPAPTEVVRILKAHGAVEYDRAPAFWRVNGQVLPWDEALEALTAQPSPAAPIVAEDKVQRPWPVQIAIGAAHSQTVMTLVPIVLGGTLEAINASMPIIASLHPPWASVGGIAAGLIGRSIAAVLQQRRAQQ